MRHHLPFLLAALALPLAASAQTPSQTPSQPPFAPLPAFPLDTNPLHILAPAQPAHPFSVVGERGAILGQQDGTFELWCLPVKVLAHARLSARIDGYDAPIELNREAATLDVRPDHTTITYAHAAITVRQHMFIPHGAGQGIATAVVLFEIHAIRPAEVTLTFEPAMERMWPAPNFDRPGGGWTPVGTGGAYTLETDNPNLFGVVAMPGAQPGELRPYQERPLTTPMTFRLRYDPAHDDHSLFPLLCAIADTTAKPPMQGPEAARAHRALLDQVIQENARVPARFEATADDFAHFFDTRFTAETPDPRVNDALRWAEVAIEQAKVSAPAGTGLAGGWFTSGDSARPGFGWFFGRDTLWSLYAVNSYGDFALTRQALDFLLARQRVDGKMMHEVSQEAEAVDWPALPYLFAAADSTPLFVMQIEDYVRASGDLAFLKQHWEQVQRAWRFTRAHTTSGIYDNSQGTGWVEEWPPGLPHQETYLAALDQQSSESLARLAHLLGDDALSAEATRVADGIRAQLPAFRAPDGTYAFSRRADGQLEAVRSIFPAVAWWTGRLSLPDAEPTLTAWSSHAFATDWGLRSVPPGEPLYDPISYHHGSVWPLYTGWAALAEYRTAHPLSAYSSLRANMQLTWLQDPGAVTEVLSGQFLAPLGRSSSHQLWSSAMVLTPAIRGLFGLEPDALHHLLRVAPQLPATWDHVTLHNVAVGMDPAALYAVTIDRHAAALDIDAVSPTPTPLCLVNTADFFAGRECKTQPALHHRLHLPLPAIEVALPDLAPSQPGAPTTQMKVLSEQPAPHQLTLHVEAPANTEAHLALRRNLPTPTLHLEGATLTADQLTVSFQGPTNTWIEKAITLSW